MTQTTTQNGSMFLRYTYDPFGNVTNINAPLTVDIDDLNRYTYNGEDYDYNTGLQYLRARYYSTSTGNFISQDTYLGDVITPLSQNRYTYCHNNPVMNDDPSGHLIFPFLAVVAGAYQLYNTYQYAKSEIAEVQDYHKQVDTYTQNMVDLAESGKMVELCQYTDLAFLGTEYLPDNVVFNNSANRYVIFDTKAQADSYHEFETKRSEAARKLWSFYGHLSLDVLGLIPGYGAIFDLTNAVWYAAEGDYVNASMSAIAAGLEIASMLKPEAKVAESTLEKYGDEAFDMNKASAKKATDVVDTIPDVCNKNKCFIAGTKVLTVDGLKAIEDIEVGDVVVATDPETGETTEKKVKNTFVNETEELAHVFVDGEEIVCTPGHKFYAPEKGWTSAIELHAGDQLQLVNGQYVTVEKVQHELLEKPVKVYNFEVEDFHTYYVGTNLQVLVHNMCQKNSKITVGRWMSQSEYEKMVATGRVQVSPNGNTTYVASPADINAYSKQAKKGSIYVEFDVDASSVQPAGREGWAQIPGPDSLYDRLNQKKGLPPINDMPKASNIVVKGKKE